MQWWRVPMYMADWYYIHHSALLHKTTPWIPKLAFWNHPNDYSKYLCSIREHPDYRFTFIIDCEWYIVMRYFLIIRCYIPILPVHVDSLLFHDNDVIMTTIASQITSLTVVYSIVYSGADQRKHQSSASLAFVRGIHRGPVNSPHKWPVTRKIFPFDDVIMQFNNQLTSFFQPRVVHKGAQSYGYQAGAWVTKTFPC